MQWFEGPQCLSLCLRAQNPITHRDNKFPLDRKNSNIHIFPKHGLMSPFDGFTFACVGHQSICRLFKQPMVGIRHRCTWSLWNLSLHWYWRGVVQRPQRCCLWKRAWARQSIQIIHCAAVFLLVLTKDHYHRVCFCVSINVLILIQNYFLFKVSKPHEIHSSFIQRLCFSLTKLFPFDRCVVLTWIYALYVSNCKPPRRSCGSFVFGATKRRPPAAANQRCWSWCWAKVGSCSATCDFGVPPVPDPWSCATKASTNGTELSRKEVDFNRGEEEKAMPSLQFSLARSCRRSMCWELWSWAIHSRSYDHGFFCGTCAWSILWQKSPGRRKKIAENSCCRTLQCI